MAVGEQSSLGGHNESAQMFNPIFFLNIKKRSSPNFSDRIISNLPEYI